MNDMGFFIDDHILMILNMDFNGIEWDMMTYNRISMRTRYAGHMVIGVEIPKKCGKPVVSLGS